MPKPTIRPATVDAAVVGLRLFSQTIQLSDIPTASRITASIQADKPSEIDVRIAHLTVYRVETREVEVELQPGEGDFGPIFVTVHELVMVAQSNGAEPVDVAIDQIVKIEIVAQPLSLELDQATGSLEVSGEGWDLISVPLNIMRVSETVMTAAPLELTAWQGGAAIATVQVAWVSGPGDDVTFHMNPFGDALGITLEVSPPTLRIEPGEVGTATLTFRVGRECSLGKKYLTVSQDGDVLNSVTILLEVTPAKPPLWQEANAAIQAKAAILNEGPPGPRAPISEVETSAGNGFVRQFSSGNLYWHRDFGAKWVYGAILVKYRELGGPFSLLGYPQTDEKDTADRRGRMSEFRGGVIYFSPQTGAKVMHGRILDHWRSLGAEASYLGFPTFDGRANATFFQTGAIRLLNEQTVFDVSDMRTVKTGVIHVDGAAANGWAELTMSSAGGWTFKGSMRSTGALSYDVLMVMSVDLQSSGGPVIAFAEKGDVEGTLVLGGDRAHTWDESGMDPRIRDNWQAVVHARVRTDFTVDFGAGDLLAVVGSILGLPLGFIAIVVAGAFLGARKRRCPPYKGHEHYNLETGLWEPTEGEVWVDKDEMCPPGLLQ